jgi:hypothetical protein
VHEEISMKRVIATATATVVTLLGAMTLNVAAQQPDTRDKTIMTFSNAVELPRMRLEKGTYIFRLADTTSRNVIQVLSQDGKETLGQWLFVSAERPEVTGDTVVTFRETSAGSTPAVQFWYYPGEKTGKEFIYPRDQALRIARRTGATVRSDDGPVTASAQAAIQADAPPSSVQAAVAVVPAVAVETQSAAVVNPAATGAGRVQLESTNAQNELPGTASVLPLSALIALLALAGVAGIRASRQPVA